MRLSALANEASSPLENVKKQTKENHPPPPLKEPAQSAQGAPWFFLRMGLYFCCAARRKISTAARLKKVATSEAKRGRVLLILALFCVSPSSGPISGPERWSERWLKDQTGAMLKISHVTVSG